MTQSLYNLLITHSKSECKDPRNRVFALLGLVIPEEMTLLGRFLSDYTMTEDNVVLIAICHVQLVVINPQEVSIDLKRLLLALGVDSVSQQRRLVKRSLEYETWVTYHLIRTGVGLMIKRLVILMSAAEKTTRVLKMTASTFTIWEGSKTQELWTGAYVLSNRLCTCLGQ